MKKNSIFFLKENDILDSHIQQPIPNEFAFLIS